LYLAIVFRDFTGAPFAFQIIEILQIQPEFRIGFEIACQAECGFRGNPSPLIDDFANTRGRDVQFAGSLLMDNPSGFIKSSRRISPGCTGGISLAFLLMFGSPAAQW
jgi:hypothetical protein